MDKKVEILARVYRGKSVEAIHYGAIAVVNAEGELTHYIGDPYEPFMTRSSIKPFQVMPLFVSGAADHFKFTPKQLAIMCGSHVGSDQHYEIVMQNLKTAGNSPENLKCGCHWPLGMMMEQNYPLNGEDKDPVRHNCSGKHSGFLAQARFLKDEIGEYLNPNSKTQQLVKRTLSDFCEYDFDKMHTGIDGCSAPNYPMPIYNLALGFKKIMNGDATGKVTKDILSRIREAITTYPEMVSGEKRLDLDMTRSFGGRLISKIGAESIQGIGFSDPAAGIAIKVHDGNQRALGAICLSIFKQLGYIKDIKDFPLLEKYEKPEVRNAKNKLTGYIVPEFELKKV